MPERRSALEWRNSRVNISRQCELLGMARSTAYYDLHGETEENIRLMNFIDYTSASEAVKSLERYFVFYNNERLHQSLEYRTPKDFHFSR